MEACVIMYGIGHSLGGASVMVNLGTLSYMSDVSPTETKVLLIEIEIVESINQLLIFSLSLLLSCSRPSESVSPSCATSCRPRSPAPWADLSSRRRATTRSSDWPQP